MIRLLALILMLCPAAAFATEIRFDLEGHARRFQLFAPDAPEAPMPLVLVLHGAFQTDNRMIAATRGRWETLAKERGFAVAFPNAINRLWDIGKGDGTFTGNPRRDDVAYLDQVIARTAARLPIDMSRIYMVGFSLGAQMTFAYVCQRGGVRGIATVSMPMPEALLSDCRRTGAIPLLSIHGTADPVIPIEGGHVPAGRGRTLDLLSEEQTIEMFAAKAGCAGPGTAKTYDRRDDGTRVNLVRWAGCSVPIWSLTIEGLGHRWPGGGPDLPAAIIGRGTEEIEGVSFVWSFFDNLN